MIVYSAPILRDGGPVGMRAILVDITECKRAEEQRIDMQRRQLHAQKLQSLGVLASGIAHDFNNLLMAMAGNLELALLNLPEPSAGRSSIEQAVKACDCARDLTRQMLAYSGEGKRISRTLDLSALVERNAHLFRAAIAKTVAVEQELRQGLPPIEADAAQAQQVVMNLVTNASEALGQKPGVIRLRTGVRDCDPEALSLSRTEEPLPAGAYVFVEVADTGCGMSEQTRQRMFEPFFTTKSTGRGLGMAGLLGIVRSHKGAVFVDSEQGRGTTVQVLFPAGAANAAGEAKTDDG